MILSSDFETVRHSSDICIVGGGMAGVCAAVSAARHGAKVVIMQDRPMFGGNASSEIRMCVMGAKEKDNREGGIIEELFLEDYYRNPDKIYQVWDGVLWGIIHEETNITPILNCSCLDCDMDGNTILSITGWQLTTQKYHFVEAKMFIDCSGDSILAKMSGAEYRMGRESCDEFGEDIAPKEADKCTMGMSCLIQTREYDTPSTFIPPDWAHHYTAEDLGPYRKPHLLGGVRFHNFWWIELGGQQDCIGDTEEIRDELLKVAYGVWDYIKNDPANVEKYANWRLDWVGILPGKRESRRCVGDYILNQNDVRAQDGGVRLFDDVIAYGVWPMDDHHPGGFNAPNERPTIFHPAPSPFGIPYRCIYSVNIGNLMFAGRNISVTHTAFSSTRVAATCGILGQAAGTAAALAISYGCSPREIGQKHIHELQQALLDDDCMLPGVQREVPQLSLQAELISDAADAEKLRSGIDRDMGEIDNGCALAPGQSAEYRFASPTELTKIRVIFDSDLNRETLPEPLQKNYFCSRPLGQPGAYVPPTLTKGYRIEGILPDGSIRTLKEDTVNRKRLVVQDISETEYSGVAFAAVRITATESWGADVCRVFAFDVR